MRKISISWQWYLNLLISQVYLPFIKTIRTLNITDHKTRLKSLGHTEKPYKTLGILKIVTKELYMIVDIPTQKKRRIQNQFIVHHRIKNSHWNFHAFCWTLNAANRQSKWYYLNYTWKTWCNIPISCTCNWISWSHKYLHCNKSSQLVELDI